MKTAKIILPWCSRLRLVFSGDAHMGNRGSDEGLLRATVGNVLNDDHAYWIDLGDALDAINMHDKRFDPAQLPEWMNIYDLVDIAGAEIARYAEIVAPLGKRILAVCEGNHEETLGRVWERNIYRELAEAMGVPDERRLGSGGFIDLNITDRRGKAYQDGSRTGSRKSWQIIIFCHHGNGGGRLMGAKALSLERLPFAFEADIYAVGHTHSKLAFTKHVITSRGAREMAMINVGSYVAPYQGGSDGYAERKLLYPQGLGPVEVWLYPEERSMKLVI